MVKKAEKSTFFGVLGLVLGLVLTPIVSAAADDECRWCAYGHTENIGSPVTVTTRTLLQLAPALMTRPGRPPKAVRDARMIRDVFARTIGADVSSSYGLGRDVTIMHDNLLDVAGLFRVEIVGKKFKLHALDPSRVRCGR
jgi:hypothetical protein